MKLDKLALIVIAVIVASIVGCDESAMVDEIIIDGLTEEGKAAIELAQLRTEPNDDAAPTNPNIDNHDKIINFNWEDATEEEQIEYWDVVVGMAVDVNVLDLADPNPPLVIEIGIGEPIKITNSGTTDHTFWSLRRGRGKNITVSAGASRMVVFTELADIDAGLVGYGIDADLVGIFYISDQFDTQFISFTVVQFLLPDGSGGFPLEGVLVTTLDEEEIVEKTDADGKVFFKRDLPLTVLLEKEGYFTTEVTVSEDGQTVILASGQRNISFRVVEPLLPEAGVYHPNWPRGFTQNGPGIEGVTVTPLEGSDEGVKITGQDGEASFFGTPPLKVRLEKPGYITIEPFVSKEEIVFPNVWPPESDVVIEQLELAEVINSGKLILSWGVYPGVVGFYDCSLVFAGLIEDDRPAMVSGLAHEAAHARQAIDSNARCGLLSEDWPLSKEGQAWVAAMEKDFKEHGPIPDFDWNDDFPWEKRPELPDPTENMASFYAEWAIGPHTHKRVFDAEEELEKFYQWAPNRCQYLEDRFGPPPPRQKINPQF